MFLVIDVLSNSPYKTDQSSWYNTAMKKILRVSSFLAITAGIVMILGGTWGIIFTYKSVAREQIITPADASIPNTPVRGPFTLKSQADIIRHHVLEMTNGMTYSQMPQKVPKIDSDGNPVLVEKGQKVMISNDARNIWITATTLTTALNFAIITYVFSGLIIFLGLVSIWTGITFRAERKGLREIML